MSNSNPFPTNLLSTDYPIDTNSPFLALNYGGVLPLTTTYKFRPFYLNTVDNYLNDIRDSIPENVIKEYPNEFKSTENFLKLVSEYCKNHLSILVINRFLLEKHPNVTYVFPSCKYYSKADCSKGDVFFFTSEDSISYFLFLIDKIIDIIKRYVRDNEITDYSNIFDANLFINNHRNGTNKLLTSELMNKGILTSSPKYKEIINNPSTKSRIIKGLAAGSILGGAAAGGTYLYRRYRKKS